MSDWKTINKSRVRSGMFASQDSDGFNGCFYLEINGVPVKVIASDCLGWQHVSVSLCSTSIFTPSWNVMCKIKDLFWDETDTVIQIHPAKSEYVNFHPGCLHLWRCTDGREQPLPPWIMVGPKDVQKIS